MSIIIYKPKKITVKLRSKIVLEFKNKVNREFMIINGNYTYCITKILFTLKMDII